jgi:hypothetical protein
MGASRFTSRLAITSLELSSPWQEQITIDGSDHSPRKSRPNGRRPAFCHP